MKTERFLPALLTLKDGEAVVEIEQSQTGALALELDLLLHGLATTLAVGAGAGDRIVISFARGAGRPGERARALRPSRDRVELELALEPIARLQAVLLRAYRDGMAEVNHVHVECQLGAAPFDLTLFFRAARPPMTPEEAGRLLGERG